MQRGGKKREPRRGGNRNSTSSGNNPYIQWRKEYSETVKD